MTGGENTQEYRGRVQAAPSSPPLPQHSAHIPSSPRPTSTASTRELGLDLATIFSKYLFQTDHLHYGYWPGDLAPTLDNLRHAQENYSEFVMGHIPAGVKTILDVGMGTGALAYRLIRAGYDVDCVSPSPYLTERARTLLGDETHIFECRYEDMVTDKRYDLILFSESFQYIPPQKSLAISCAHLQPWGHLLLCDFFRKDTLDDGPMGGGHRLQEFRQLVADYPLQLLIDEDITAQTAPNLDLIADFAQRVVRPAKDRIFACLSVRHPLPFRFACWMFRKHLRRADEKYFSGKRNGASFSAYKSYRLMLLQQCRATQDSV